MKRAIAGLTLAVWAGMAWGADSSLARQQEEARQRQADLRARIATLQKEIESQESARRDAANALKDSESAISDINRRLADIDARRGQVQETLRELGRQADRQKEALAQRQHELGEQLRGQYAGGLSPWTALLSGNDPQEIGRDLGYLSYVTRAQTSAVHAVRQALDELAATQERQHAAQKELEALAAETATRKQELEAQQQERKTVLARIESQLAEQRGQAQQLTRNDKRLGELITGLEAEIQRQAELARQEAERRRIEAARKAEEARQAEARRRQELARLERERERAREAELAARQAQQQAERQRQADEAAQAREQVERARQQAREAEQAARRARQQAQEERESARQGGSLRGTAEGLRPDASGGAAASSEALHGLPKQVPAPVKGEVQGKFGAQRPDGGLWRGIVLRAPEGTPVHAVAAGRVVYANWLAGFGNIMIVDHGAKYLSVYAYNQSLLKQVGDMVQAGDTIAAVGATGGQVEPGLYFEIRHQGTPENPLLWLSR
jgi:septal ring factor EnvC (AmiA/AmiB activator)